MDLKYKKFDNGSKEFLPWFHTLHYLGGLHTLLICQFLKRLRLKWEVFHSLCRIQLLIPQYGRRELKLEQRDREGTHGGEGEEPAKPAVALGVGREAKPALEELLGAQP